VTYTRTFWLPFPPSVNRIWRYARGKAYLSKEYVAWKKKADACSYEQKLFPSGVYGMYSMEIKLSDGFKRFGDVDNRLKAVADWCQRAQLIFNDRACVKASIEWDSVIDHDCVVTLQGEIAFPDQWAFAQYEATRKLKRRRA
jgi:Holliday junction resolvase RusA-like endonuclease